MHKYPITGNAADVPQQEMDFTIKLLTNQLAEARKDAAEQSRAASQLADALLRKDEELLEARRIFTTLNVILDRISEESDQPFTETHENLPDWIKTILQTRPDFSFREGVKAATELKVMREDVK
jgi:hypothetical protein